MLLHKDIHYECQFTFATVAVLGRFVFIWDDVPLNIIVIIYIIIYTHVKSFFFSLEKLALDALFMVLRLACLRHT